MACPVQFCLLVKKPRRPPCPNTGFLLFVRSWLLLLLPLSVLAHQSTGQAAFSRLLPKGCGRKERERSRNALIARRIQTVWKICLRNVWVLRQRRIGKMSCGPADLDLLYFNIRLVWQPQSVVPRTLRKPKARRNY